MTTLEDDVRAALRQRAEAHEVTVPPVADLIGTPYAEAPAPPPRRRLVVGVTAALLAVALGATAAALVRNDNARPPVATDPEPVAGTHGAILVGFGPPVDASEMAYDPPADVDPVAPGPLVILERRTGGGTAVVTFSDGMGYSSFDMPARDGGTPIEVDGRSALLHEPNDLHPRLLTLEVDLGQGPRRLFVGGRHLDQAALEDLAVAALGATDPLDGWWPDDYTATYAGPDLNPFARGVDVERQMAYEVDGRPVAVTFAAGAADPVDYAWFHDGGTVTEVDGRTVVRWPGGNEWGQPWAAWAEAGGMVVVSGPEDVLDAAVAAVRMVDRATWEAELASATARGSRFQTGTTEAPPVTTR